MAPKTRSQTGATRRQTPYTRSPHLRSRTRSTLSPEVKLDFPLWYPLDEVQNAPRGRRKTMFELMADALIDDDPEVLQHRQTLLGIAERVETFFKGVQAEYPWLKKGLDAYEKQPGTGSLVFKCSADEAYEAYDVLNRIATFQKQLDDSHPWLRAIFKGLTERMEKSEVAATALTSLKANAHLTPKQPPEAALAPVPDSTSKGKQVEPRRLTLTGPPSSGQIIESRRGAQSRRSSAGSEPCSCPGCPGAGSGVCSYSGSSSGSADESWLHNLGSERSVPKVLLTPPGSPDTVSSTSSSSSTRLTLANYVNWTKGTAVDCQQLKKQTTVILHPEFSVNKSRWMYLHAGGEPEDPNRWTIGDILFTPLPPFTLAGHLPMNPDLVLRTPFVYLVCAPDDKTRVLNVWKPYRLGQGHPLDENFVLQHFYGQVPFWVYRTGGDAIGDVNGGKAPGEAEASENDSQAPKAGPCGELDATKEDHTGSDQESEGGGWDI
ncbi:hypothetical protein FRC11_006758 [Ceratobasidium sp. 423]|nr:hypothetical protein FRC11_006758 [Ceratobasidium sp. 423]